MNTRCPHCGKTFEVDEAYNGQNTNCIFCGKPFAVVGVNEVNSVPANVVPPFPQAQQVVIVGTTAEKRFKAPILAVICDILGVLCIIAAVIYFMLSIACLVDDRFFKRSDFPDFLWIALSCIGSGIINIGIAQIISCVAKTAFNTDRIVELLRNRR